MLLALMSAVLLQPAAPPATACAAIDRNLPASMRPWLSPVAAGTTVQPGQAVTLAPSTTLALVVTEAGTYGVATDQTAWVEVTRDGASLHSNGNGHGPPCSSIRKTVDFQ